MFYDETDSCLPNEMAQTSTRERLKKKDEMCVFLQVSVCMRFCIKECIKV